MGEIFAKVRRGFLVLELLSTFMGVVVIQMYKLIKKPLNC